jgi:hypothetical protein
MRGVLIALVVLQVLVPLGASAIEGKVLVELACADAGLAKISDRLN